MESLVKVDDFGGTPSLGNTHIHIYNIYIYNIIYIYVYIIYIYIAKPLGNILSLLDPWSPELTVPDCFTRLKIPLPSPCDPRPPRMRALQHMKPQLCMRLKWRDDA